MGVNCSLQPCAGMKGLVSGSLSPVPVEVTTNLKRPMRLHGPK